jgi:hypothetical protein
MVVWIQYVSIIIELAISILGLLIVFQKKKIYGWGIFLTFLIYVFYDFARVVNWSSSPNLLYGSFFIATVSAFWFVFNVYKEGKKK